MDTSKALLASEILQSYSAIFKTLDITTQVAQLMLITKQFSKDPEVTKDHKGAYSYEKRLQTDMKFKDDVEFNEKLKALEISRTKRLMLSWEVVFALESAESKKLSDAYELIFGSNL